MLIICISSCDPSNRGPKNESPNDTNGENTSTNNDVNNGASNNTNNVDNESKNSHYMPTAAVMTEEIDGKTNLVLTWDFYFNEQNTISQLAASANNSDGVIIDLTYDVKDNLIKEGITYADGYNYTYEYTYDGYGNCIKAVKISEEGNRYTTTYDLTYDNDGNILKKVSTAFNGYTRIYEYIYDENGDCTKEVYNNEDGDSYTIIYSYTYNKNGKIVEKGCTKSNGNITIYKYTYDENGNLIKVVENYDDDYVLTTVFTYTSVDISYGFTYEKQIDIYDIMSSV